ncbi:ABC transporter ATP-binding protein [Solicola sp. PLA-1-18]|uniref:ABC transporter ATP-binding protein n=1 Tax=Solicola sp. PLA-1-18 TaxID=3380532 RepID=UPI003B7E606F
MLSVTSLTRRFGDRTAVDAVSFDVRPGRLTGFVGANGAGKTTTMRMIVGVLGPSSGDVLWDGAPLTREQRRSFGYMPEERGLYPKMTVLDQLVFFARLHGFSQSDAVARASELLERLGLSERVGDVLETLSLGNQQRVQIAAALVHRPIALVLDEPFSGLDPLAVDSMVGLLREEVTAEVPVLFSSHQLDLVERLCDDVVILSDGRVVTAGDAESLRRQGPVRYRIGLGEGDSGWLRELDGVHVLDAEGSTALVELAGLEPADLLTAVHAKHPVTEFAPVVRPLSEIYKESIA